MNKNTRIMTDDCCLCRKVDDAHCYIKGVGWMCHPCFVKYEKEHPDKEANCEHCGSTKNSDNYVKHLGWICNDCYKEYKGEKL